LRPPRHRTGTGLTPPSPTSWPTPNTPGTWSTAGAARPDGRGSTRRLVPPEQWIWSEQPTHPAIITRDMFSAAQGIAAEHRSAGDDPNASPQPLARRTPPPPPPLRTPRTGPPPPRPAADVRHPPHLPPVLGRRPRLLQHLLQM